jgi:hypothetical protein
MDASVYRSAFGTDEYVLSDGNKCAGSMPSINQFEVLDGLISMQGHQIQVTQETLAVDTCANGYERIDLVCMRFTHDNNTLIDATSLVVIKGTEVQTGNTPVPPTYNTGVIDQGATIVDMPLYQINLAGATVTYERLCKRAYSTKELQPLKIDFTSFSSLPQSISDSRIFSDHIVRPGDIYLSNPSAQTSEWEIETFDGSVTIKNTGTISGSTTSTIWLTIPE